MSKKSPDQKPANQTAMSTQRDVNEMNVEELFAEVNGLMMPENYLNVFRSLYNENSSIRREQVLLEQGVLLVRNFQCNKSNARIAAIDVELERLEKLLRQARTKAIKNEILPKVESLKAESMRHSISFSDIPLENHMSNLSLKG